MLESHFWKQLTKPIIALSPMDGVTDQPYRFIQKKYGNPALIYTEFTSVEGICHGALKLLTDFFYDETQRPIIAQIYGHTPEYFRQTATLLCELGFDGIDINMGCPAKSVQHSGSGAALIKTPELAQKIIRETQAGVKDWVNGKTSRDCKDITEEIAEEVEKRHKNLPTTCQEHISRPVSVKTRIGFSHPVVDEWIPTLLECKPAAIGLHGRTLKQQYGGFANWDQIAKAAHYCSQAEVPILGNGDVKTLEDAYEKCKTYRVDGVLIGRGSFGNPAVFLEKIPEKYPSQFALAIEHSQLFEQFYAGHERFNFFPMRKHLGWYVRGMEGAAELRSKLFQANSSEEVRGILNEFHISNKKSHWC